MPHLILHTIQKAIARSIARFKVIRAGRKGGKTAFEIEKITHRATVKVGALGLQKTDFPTGRKVIYIAPTQEQARNIVWEALKTRLAGVGKPSEQHMQMRVPNADGKITTIFVGGWENRENYRGLSDVVHITFDETDSLKDFFIAWKEIFRPMFLDTGGTADFIGTPKKQNPNMRRLERENEGSPDWEFFHFTSNDNPYLPEQEKEQMKKDYEKDPESYKQEVLAEYVDAAGALFHYDALVDMFTNTVPQSPERYHIVDIADDGSDKTVSAIWDGMQMSNIEMFDRYNTENIINMIREKNAEYRVPYSHTAVDAIGVGAGVASSSLLDGIIGFKSSYQPLRTDPSIVQLPNVHYRKDAPLTSEYRNLRSQCVFTLALRINNHEIALRVPDIRIKEMIIEELSLYQEITKGDVKRQVTSKEDIKAFLGRSPDLSDVLIMRMYFAIRQKISPENTEERQRETGEMQMEFDAMFNRRGQNSAR